MRKTVKKITAIMLSLVMLLGCVPNFTNIVSAADLTIESALNKAVGGFPANLYEAWQNEYEDKVIYKDGYLEFYAAGSDTSNDMLKPSGEFTLTDDYKWSMMDPIIVFNINENKLDSLSVTGSGDLQGTYKPTIYCVDLISTGVLATNINTLKFDVEDPDSVNFIVRDEPTTTWYSDENCETAYSITESSSGDTIYRPIVICPKVGFIIDGESTVSASSGQGRICSADKDGNNLKAIVSATVKDVFTKSATITFPNTAGTTVEQIKNSFSISTTETEGLATIDTNNLILYYADDIELNTSIDEPLEEGKEYISTFYVKDKESAFYTSVKVNGTDLDDYGVTLSIPKTANVFYKPLGPAVGINYKFKAVNPAPVSSGGSKKYKAEDNDTAEKVSGSGKKGSTRTIVPEDGRRVKNVTVTDKKGNLVEVTMNEDGTYSFTQPASDVIINVDYAAREIQMEVGVIGATIDGIGVNEYVTPKVRNNETMLPVRFIAENLGAKVDWNELEPNMIYITKGDKKIEIKLGSNIIKVNGEEITLNSSPFAEGNRTYVPFKLIENALDASVQIDATNQNGIIVTEK